MPDNNFAERLAAGEPRALRYRYGYPGVCDHYEAELEKCHDRIDELSNAKALAASYLEQGRAEVDRLRGQRDTALQALRNVLMLAQRMRRHEPNNPHVDHLVRFCASAGVEPSVLRGDEEPPA